MRRVEERRRAERDHRETVVDDRAQRISGGRDGADGEDQVSGWLLAVVRLHG